MSKRSWTSLPTPLHPRLHDRSRTGVRHARKRQAGNRAADTGLARKSAGGLSSGTGAAAGSWFTHPGVTAVKRDRGLGR